MSSTASVSTETSSVRGILLMLLAVFIFASQDGITKILIGQYDAPQILLVRFAAFALFVTLWVAKRGGIKKAATSRRPVMQIVRCLLIAVEIGLFAWIVHYMPLADVHALFAAAPLMITALSVPLLGEVVGIRRWSAVGVGFIGVLIILRPGVAAVSPVAMFVLLGALMFALYVVLTRLVSRGDSSETSLFYMAWVGFAFSVIVGPFYWTWPDLEGWFWLLALACTSITGHVLFVMALKEAPAAVLQPYQYTILVWAALFGFVFFGDIPDLPTVIGASIIVASGLYTLYREQIVGRRVTAPVVPGQPPSK
ncbi:DMT family transporter [Hwanghaeella sp.]|uniref:DMT family transporter n=1 Tax=Hwanghaeella sp. TaxID=2605943 RepID=UPI003CCBFDAD